MAAQVKGEATLPAMLVDEIKRVPLRWELNSFCMQILRKEILLF